MVISSLGIILAGCGGTATLSSPPSGAAGLDGTPLDAAKPIKIALLSPREGEVVAGPDVSVSFSLENYALAPSGNHVHVILDNEPYMPWYRTDAPCVLKNVKPGPHVLRVFPSRPWHESWKNPEAFAMVRFFVKEKSGGHTLEVDKPLLTYSRPKGEYAGDQAKKILLDFWVRNAVLSPEGYKVRVTLDGEAKLLTKWEPVWWEGLAPGLHGVVLELLDAEGRLVDNAFSRTERTFVIRGPLETTPATPHQH